MITKEEFFRAISEENADVVKEAISEGFDVNTLTKHENGTALNMMASRGNISMCQILIDNGANLESCTKYGMTPLLSAVVGFSSPSKKEKKADYLEIIKMLLVAGAKPTYVSKQGEEKLAYLLVDGLARRQVRDIFVKLGIVEKSKEEIIAEKKTAQSEVVSVKSETQEERTFKKAYLPQPSIFEAITSMFFGQPKGESEDARPLIKSGLKLKKE